MTSAVGCGLDGVQKIQIGEVVDRDFGLLTDDDSIAAKSHGAHLQTSHPAGITRSSGSALRRTWVLKLNSAMHFLWSSSQIITCRIRE